MDEIMKHGDPMLEKVFGPNLVKRYIKCAGRRGGTEYDIVNAISCKKKF